jgi:hypothetical protein
MTTVKTAPEARSSPPSTTRARRVPLVGTVLALLVALLIGGTSGWFVRGSVDDSQDVVAAGQSQPSERQAEIAEFVNQYEQAWQEGDADGVVSMYTPNGTATFLGTTYRVDDGSLAEFIGTGYASLDVLAPIIVSSDGRAVMFHTVTQGTYVDIMRFTREGELLLVSHEISR